MKRASFRTLAADGGRPEPAHANQVCITCKTRKKKCDKVLPRCGYCVRRRLACEFERPRKVADGAALHSTSPLTILAEPSASQTNLYHRAHGLIRAAGQFVEDISARYFQGIHRYLPIISRTRFHSSLITLGAAPSPGFSILLVSLCLVTSHEAQPANTNRPRPIDKTSLHQAAKSLFAQVQGFFEPSIHLIQASLLLSVYEYTNNWPDEAFISIAGCARMAYAARIHQKIDSAGAGDTHTDLRLAAEEEANTWWGIVVCERIFSREVTVLGQPLATLAPSGDSRLPTEPEVLEQSDLSGSKPALPAMTSDLGASNIGGFGHTAQAAWLLDQLLNILAIPDIDSRMSQLHNLDATLQTFLGVLVDQYLSVGGIFCQAIAMGIMALFTLHWDILDHIPNLGHGKRANVEELTRRSQVALDTSMKMVLDIAKSYGDSESRFLDTVAPSYSYMIRAALKNVYRTVERRNDRQLRDNEDQLRTSLDQFNRHWDIGGY